MLERRGDFIRKWLWQSRKTAGLEKCIFEIDGERLQVPRDLLRSRTELFNAMHAQASDAKPHVVVIDGVGLESMEAFIEFLYFEEIQGYDELEKDELFCIANKFGMNSLKDYCIQKSMRSPDVLSFIDNVQLAYHYDCKKHKDAIFDFIENQTSLEYFVALLSSKDWKQLQLDNIDAAAEVLEKIMDRLERR